MWSCCKSDSLTFVPCAWCRVERRVSFSPRKRYADQLPHRNLRPKRKTLTHTHTGPDWVMTKLQLETILRSQLNCTSPVLTWQQQTTYRVLPVLSDEIFFFNFISSFVWKWIKVGNLSVKNLSSEFLNIWGQVATDLKCWKIWDELAT